MTSLSTKICPFSEILKKLTYESDHMEEGYPGKLTAVVKYLVKG